MAVWYSLWSFTIFFLFWYFGPRKIWQPRAGTNPMIVGYSTAAVRTFHPKSLPISTIFFSSD
jgi:hypothetical protein